MINEIGNTPEGQFMLGRLQGRQNQRARGEQTSGRIKQTTRRADDYWRGTDFNDGENFEDSQSWADSYDDYDQYGDFDSEAYERNQQERERDQERQSELYSRVQNKLNKKTKNENKNMSKKNTIKLNESDYKVKFALQTLNYYYDYAMECFNDPHRGYPKQAVAKVIQAAKTLLPYKGQGVDVKNALIKAKELSNLAKREVEIDRKGREISDNEGGLAYMDYLDSVGKIPMVGESVKKGVINKNKNTMKKQLNETIEPKHLEFLEDFIGGSYMDIADGTKTFNDAFNEFLQFVKVPFSPAEIKKLQKKGRQILLQAEKEQDELFDEIGGFDSVDYRQNYYENKKRTVKLTEAKLKNIITECVRETLRDIL